MGPSLLFASRVAQVRSRQLPGGPLRLAGTARHTQGLEGGFSLFCHLWAGSSFPPRPPPQADSPRTSTPTLHSPVAALWVVKGTI